jgi:hypothetical protein
MGQPITVTSRAGASPSVWIFDLNRSITGMAIEKYSSADEARERGGRPPDVLALRLFEAGAGHVTIYSNTITVEAPADRWAELEPKAASLIEHLFEYYGEAAGWSFEARGVEPPPPIDPS